MSSVEDEPELPPAGAPVGPVPPDSVAQTQTSASPSASTGLNFDGLGAGSYGYSIYWAPPDTNGAVGSTQYVQIVNLAFAIFDKASGNLQLGPVDINTLWTGFGGACEDSNNGDPVVLYDKAAKRWVIAQFALPGFFDGEGGFYQCVAVSATDDATGRYYRYAFSFDYFPDYPKMSVWPDGYYATFNMFAPDGSAYIGADACAMDRTSMLAGNAATMQCIPSPLGWPVASLLPSDLDGSTPPPSGSPNFFVEFDQTTLAALNLYKFHVDWVNPSNSTFTGPVSIPVAPFTPACGGFAACVAQLGSPDFLDSLGDRLMYRLAYRNFGDHESLTVNHSVDPGTSGAGNSGVRWYEILDPNGTPAVAQQGTFSPADGISRWMGSVAMDQHGDMMLGYSVSSSTIHPGIRVTGRLASDPANTLQAETTVLDGATLGSQIATYSRWGDYSSMSIDPVDDCTFWFTTEYIPITGSFNWHTRIAAMKFNSCEPVNLAPNALSFANQAVGTTSSPQTITLTNNQKVTLNISSIAASGDFSQTNDCGSTIPSGGTCTITVTFTPTATGTRTGNITVTDDAPNSPQVAYLRGVVLADLVETNITSGTTAPISGGSLQVTDTAMNQGVTNASSSVTAFYLSTDGSTRGAVLGSRNVPTLQAGSSSTGASTLTLPLNLTGTYYVIACADSNNAVVESNEYNNCAASGSFQVAGADLVENGVSVLTSAPVAGGSVQVTETTSNQGAGNAGGSNTGIFLSADGITSEMLLGYRSVPPLSAGSSSGPATTTVTLPSYLTGGTYYLIACADNYNVVVESDESNNCTLSGAISILATPAFSPSAGTYSTPQTVTLSDATSGATIYYTTDGSTPTTSSTLYTGPITVSTTTTINAIAIAPGFGSPSPIASAAYTLVTGTPAFSPFPGAYVEPPSVTLTDITPGAVIYYTTDGSTPTTSSPQYTGPISISRTTTINVMATAPGYLPSTVGSGTYTITQPPDLVESAVSIVSASPVPSGGSVQVSDTTTNQSAGSAGSSGTGFYLSTDGVAKGAYLGSRLVPALAGETSSGPVTTTLTLPLNLNGTYYVVACADFQNIVVESNETNNCTASASFQVSGADLVVSSVSIVSSSPLPAGGTLQISDTTTNQGAGNSGSAATGFFVSTDVTTKGAYLGSRVFPSLAAGTSSGPVTTTVTLPTTLNGTYYVIACADFQNILVETNESNNCTTSGSFQVAGADLVVSAASIVSTSPIPSGGSLQISDTTTNQGVGNAGNSTTVFYLSTNGTTKGAILGYRPLTSLAAGASSGPATTTVTLPLNLNGTYYVIACADYYNTVVESNESNNCTTSGSFQVAGADLVESAVTIVSTSPVPSGGSLQISDTTSNQGGGNAGSSNTGFYLSTDGVTRGAFLGTRWVPSLAAGANSGPVTTTVTLPINLNGTYYVIACSDYYNSVAESSETNNCTASDSFQAAAADLVESAVSIVSTSPVSSGGSLQISDTTTNQGVGTAGSSLTEFYLSTDGTTKGAALGSRSIGWLTAGASSGAVTTSVTLPSNLNGSYYVIACADYYNAVVESNESNNCTASGSFQVQ